MPVVPIDNKTKTLAEIRNEVYRLVSERPDSKIFPKEFVDTAINNAIAIVARALGSEKSDIFFSVESDEGIITLPDCAIYVDRAMVHEVKVDGDTIQRVPKGAYDASNTGKPTSYFVDQNKIYLIPSPDGVYRIDISYQREPSKLVNDDDTTWLPDDAIFAVQLYACYILKLKDNEFDAARNFKNEFMDTLSFIKQLKTGVYKYSPNSGGVI